jgi:uncharacterized membrane protein
MLVRRPQDRSRGLFAIAALILAIVFAIAFFWTGQERDAARNDGRVGTTTETSPKNPTPTPGGGSDKSGG